MYLTQMQLLAGVILMDVVGDTIPDADEVVSTVLDAPYAASAVLRESDLVAHTVCEKFALSRVVPSNIARGQCSPVEYFDL